jgi:hypothetical protein
VLGRQFKPGLVNVNSYNRSTQRGSDLHAESTDSSHTHKYCYVVRF